MPSWPGSSASLIGSFIIFVLAASSGPERWSLRRRAHTPSRRLPGWLREAGFREIDEAERPFWWQGEDLASQAGYAADVIESALDALAQLPGSDEEELREGLADLRRLPELLGAGLGYVMHKSTAVR